MRSADPRAKMSMPGSFPTASATSSASSSSSVSSSASVPAPTTSTPAAASPTASPILGSPSSDSALSSSSSSAAAFMSLVGATTATPLSSIDDREVCSPSNGLVSDAEREDSSAPSLTKYNFSFARSQATAELVSAPAAQSQPPAQATADPALQGRKLDPPCASMAPNDTNNTTTNTRVAEKFTAADPFCSFSSYPTTPLSILPPLPESAPAPTLPSSLSYAAINDPFVDCNPFVSHETRINTTDAAATASATLATSTATTTPSPLVRPRFTNTSPPVSAPEQPAIVRTTSSNGRLRLRQPVPEANARSGIFAGNIAQLEASAERLSMTSSIDDAIRQAHQELKRSDSRRSSILAARVARAASDSSHPCSDTHSIRSSRQSFSRPNSILGLHSALRSGGIMSPTSSLSGTGLHRSGSKASSVGSIAGGVLSSPVAHPVGELSTFANDSFQYMSRSGPGKMSVHSTRSGHNTLPEIAETEPPVTITQQALDEADRLIASGAGPDVDDDDTIRAKAHQRVESDYGYGLGDYNSAQNEESWQQPDHYAYQQSASQERPKSSASGATYEQAQVAFGDFDGVHCDPDASAEHIPVIEEEPLDLTLSAQPPSQPPLGQPLGQPSGQPVLQPRPTSYLDPTTGQQMLYYPARVPAMLQLPPKLSKNRKTAERNKRQTQLYNMMMQEEHLANQNQRQSWLPDPVVGTGSPLLSMDESTADFLSKDVQSPEANAAAPETEALGPGEPMDPSNFRRPARLTDPGKRKSRMSALRMSTMGASALGKLPPQLRASAFFDLPSTSPAIQVQNGSATETLDSILDAAAKAPVSAFVDHAYAGKLGSEVYGTGKKRNKSAAAAKADPHSTEQRDLKKRGSIMSLMGHVRKSSGETGDGKRSTIVGVNGRRDLSDGAEPSPGLSEGGMLSPDEDERVDEDRNSDEDGEEDEDEEEEDVYQGAPTTLLAELQIRKQQQKLRTRPTHKMFPNGMHSTLLELDAVAQVEQKARKGKRVNLAWEDPSLNRDDDDEDDEDVPLGLLFAAKAAGHNDISAAVAEINRPLGLMEKKEMEDNEPLSKRRDRLQGRAHPVSMYLNVDNSAVRQSTLTLRQAGGSGQSPRFSLTPASIHGGDPIAPDGDADGVEEVDDEPLSSRLQRMKAKEESELPRAGSVSLAFTNELLGQFADPEEEAKEKEKAKEAKEAPPPEEQETLGQRRRRLQAEKDARDEEMRSGSALRGPTFNNQALDALNGGGAGGGGMINRRLSMADMLGAHPAGKGSRGLNPLEIERQKREAEAAQYARSQEMKMAAMRAQMPQSIPQLAHGGYAGGFMGGQYNSGNGAMNMQTAAPAFQGQNGFANSQWPAYNTGFINQAGNVRGLQSMQSMGNLGYLGAGGMGGMGVAPVNNNFYGMMNASQPQLSSMGGGFGAGFASNNYGMQGGYGGQRMSMQMPMQMPMQQGGRVDRVEQWRQSILP